ncbi:chitin deacetylase 8 [Cylas formicarius]|uniref:chitin deacetylase 8 n=1 Tax=Cylas formicarius TaxID=197179 RepID=UPI0029587709|nr:chitin deacetylase 8 [Cylas formicarius]
MRALAVIFAVALCAPSVFSGDVAQQCSDDLCKIDEECRCSSTANPVAKDQAPQLIALTFFEAVTQDLFDTYWDPLLFNRINPDGNVVGATFFVPHEYTDYERVNDLYNYGFEIGVHSITKNNLQSYWRNAPQELLEQEFGGQKKIISKFANIPEKDIIGVRTPQLQLNGNYSISAFVDAGFKYDSSWPTQSNRPLLPYTLDYLSSQDCELGATCPNEPFKGFWILPIVDLNGAEDKQCNSLGACDVSGTVDEISDWLFNEVQKVRNNNRAPLTIVIESNWFEKTKTSFEALQKTVDRLLDLKDVFFINLQQVIEWIEDPVPLSEFKTHVYDDRSASCRAVTCKLVNEDQEDRYMKSCVTCPSKYPWLGNPDGN